MATAVGPSRDRLTWEHCVITEKEWERERAEHVLRHIRFGGWGLAHLNARKADVPFLLKDSRERTIFTDRIRDMAQSYYSDLFAQPEPHF